LHEFLLYESISLEAINRPIAVKSLIIDGYPHTQAFRTNSWETIDLKEGKSGKGKSGTPMKLFRKNDGCQTL